MSSSNADSASEIDLEAEFHAGSDARSAPESDRASGADANSDADSESTSLADRLDTAATVLWAAFLAFVVAVALVPVAAVGLGIVPFAPPRVGPYFGFVGLALVGTLAIIAVAVYRG